MSQQSWFETADGGFGKATNPQNQAAAKNREQMEVPAMISARDNTAALIEKIEEDKEWVKVGDKDSDETRAMSKVSSK